MTLYKKEGRKYIAVQDTEAYNGLENGCWLVKVEKGSTSIRKAVEPAMPALQFAALIAANKISQYLLRVSEARPQNRKYSKKQLKIIKQFQDLPDHEKLLFFEYDSLHEMAEKILNLILENYENSKK